MRPIIGEHATRIPPPSTDELTEILAEIHGCLAQRDEQIAQLTERVTRLEGRASSNRSALDEHEQVFKAIGALSRTMATEVDRFSST